MVTNCLAPPGGISNVIRTAPDVLKPSKVFLAFSQDLSLYNILDSLATNLKIIEIYEQSLTKAPLRVILRQRDSHLILRKMLDSIFNLFNRRSGDQNTKGQGQRDVALSLPTRQHEDVVTQQPVSPP